MADQRFYSEEEAEEILREASRLSRPGESVTTPERLAEMAAELGISQEALAEAETRVRQNRQEALLRTEFLSHRRQKVRSDALQWLSLSFLLFGINLFTNNFSLHLSGLWSLWPIGFIGLFLAYDWLEGLALSPEDRERKFEKWKQKRERRNALSDRFLGGPVPTTRVDEVLDQYYTLHDADDRIGAIRAVREQTGLDLKSAKMMVEEYCRLRGISS